jgi:hypothetical protein
MPGASPQFPEQPYKTGSGVFTCIKKKNHANDDDDDDDEDTANSCK